MEDSRWEGGMTAWSRAAFKGFITLIPGVIASLPRLRRHASQSRSGVIIEYCSSDTFPLISPLLRFMGVFSPPADGRPDPGWKPAPPFGSDAVCRPGCAGEGTRGGEEAGNASLRGRSSG